MILKLEEVNLVKVSQDSLIFIHPYQIVLKIHIGTNQNISNLK